MPGACSHWLAPASCGRRHEGSGQKVVIVTEVQKDPPDGDKRRAWVAYLALAQVEHKCDAALVVIALRERTARASGRPISTGHPGFVRREIYTRLIRATASAIGGLPRRMPRDLLI